MPWFELQCSIRAFYFSQITRFSGLGPRQSAIPLILGHAELKWRNIADPPEEDWNYGILE
ncbi:hypothetical protein D1AOALGA4SA_569 [Olavius algarvensis Delta 1 endosymbiont]|nr:hypothetical protein D1AOALGA4SA_569 [Olavius algarvensis Delta 1 endosymbiont]